jgi:hypothetical protein
MNEIELTPVSVRDRLAMAGHLAKSGLMPASMKTAEQVFIALQWGAELGLTPMVSVNSVYVINGKPTLSVDVMHAIARKHPEFAGEAWKSQTSEKSEVVIYRQTKWGKEEFVGYYDISMAKKAKLIDKDTWVKFPERMLKHRALSYALRDAFPDVLAGVYSVEEMDGVAGFRDVTPIPTGEELAQQASASLPAPESASASVPAPAPASSPDPQILAKRKQLLDNIKEVLESEYKGQQIFSQEELDRYHEQALSFGNKNHLEAINKMYEEVIKTREDRIMLFEETESSF